MADKLGTFYGVGVGPGDPELLTLKAVRVLESCPVLAAPQMASGEMTALSIARQAARLEGKTLLPLRFTMSRDRAEQAEGHRRAADAVRPYLEAGQDVAMAILGDVSIYSTYCYMMELLKAEGFPCVMVPGVPSFCAVAARLGRSLTEPDQPLHIIPGGGPGLGEALDLPGSKVLMKAGTTRSCWRSWRPGSCWTGRLWWRTAACRRSGLLRISRGNLIPMGTLPRS